MQQTILDALRDGDNAAALATAREMVTAQPQDATAHRLLAAALRANGERDAAVAAIDQAIALVPEEPELHLERASLLLDARQLDDAEAALARTTGLDPNQFPAYIMQAHLALARGELDDAERLARTAARIAPLHPRVAAVEGLVALRRNDPDRALVILTRAFEQAPDEPQLRHGLALAYLVRGHHAFAEQAFRGLLENEPDSLSVRSLLARTLHRQGRPAEAAEVLAPLLERSDPSPALQRMAGQLELEADRPQQALPLLRAAFEAQPQERRNLLALVDAWRRLGAADDARSTLETALAAHPQSPDLWRARLLFEEFAGDAAREIVSRWQQAMPTHVPALEAMIAIHDRAGETEAAEALVARIIELQPGHAEAELRHIDGLLLREPDAAIARVESLIAQAGSDKDRRRLRSVLSRCQDATGRYDDAAATWADLHRERSAQRWPLPAASATADHGRWPALAERDPDRSSQVLLWGAPGSLVERLAQILRGAGLPLLDDRFRVHAPDDLFQHIARQGTLPDGEPSALIERWREQLAARGVRSEGTVFDWLPHWDNTALTVLRPQLPEAMLLIALRDPRDMLLGWLGYGSAAPFALESPLVAARWLAQLLTQIADLHQHNLFPHRLVHLDDDANDVAALSQRLSQALQVELTVPPSLNFASALPAGHWRRYAAALAGPLAELEPVARRLGYPDA